MNRIFNKLIPFIVVAGGILFIVLGFCNAEKQKTYTKADAVITNIVTNDVGDETEHDVFVEYTVNGNTVEAELGEYSSSMNIGDSITICYNPQNPTDIVKAGATASAIMISFGVVATIAGIFLIIKKFVLLLNR